MIEKKIIRFDKGMNEYSIYKELDSPDDIRNYEYIKGGQLQIRKQASEWNTSLSSSASSVYNIDSIFVWYPDNQHASASSNESVLLFGSSSNLLKLFYRKSGASYWGHEDITVVDYQASSNLRFYEGTDKLLIADGINVAHYLKIDTEGDLIQSKLGVERPERKPTASTYEGISDWDDDDWEESNEEDGIGDCGLFQYVYTIETEGGDESNPSPLSNTIDRQYFNQASDGSQMRWVDRIVLENMYLPSGLDADFVDRIEAFNIYRREAKYSAGGNACNLYKVSQVLVKNKYNDSASAIKNSNVDVDTLNLSVPVDYDNNIAPVAGDVCEVGGYIVLSDTQTKMNFPYDFQYQCPIKIQNKDSRNFVDAVIRVRLYGSECNSASDPIEYLDWEELISASATEIKDSTALRFYDTDSHTPLPVVYMPPTSWAAAPTQASEVRWLDVFVKIPNLLPETTHTIYFTWTANSASASGVNDSWYNNASYGKFISIDADTPQQVFNSIRVKDENTKICSPTNERDWSSFNNISNILPNKADTSKNASFYGSAAWNSGTENLKALRLVETKGISVVGESQAIILPATNDYIGYDLGHNTMNDKFTFYSWVTIDQITASALPWIYTDSHVGEEDGLWMRFTASGASSHLTLEIMSENSGSIYDTEVYIENTDSKKYFIGVSFDFDNDKFTAFVKDLDTEYSDMNEVGINTSKPVISASAQVWIGNFSANHENGLDYIAMPFMEKDNYINEENKWQQLSNVSPEFDEMIGYNHSDETHNNLITMDEAKKIRYERMKNAFRWSKANSVAFPYSNLRTVSGRIKRIIPAPSFLPFKYQNTILIFGRNRIYRFVLKEDSNSWVTGADIVIPEIRRLGLLAPDSLVEAQESLYWLSEVGVVKWSPEGMDLISQKIIDVTTKNYE